MKVLQIGSIIVAITITAAFPIGKNPSAEPNVAAEAEANPEMPKSLAPSVETNHSPGSESSALSEEKTISHSPETPHSKSENYPTDSTRELVRPVLSIFLSLWRTSTCKKAGGRCVGVSKQRSNWDPS